MIFLIDYDRVTGRLISLTSYEDGRRVDAENARLELELELHRRKVEREVVLLEAPNVDAVRRTHGRYFESLEELARTPIGSDT